ncbi:uncharacterized protein EI90DRAFT_3056977 [Cantharellus anzutake]|uniref:uncharacterized protein n=1 Tax=Cantharellus anzutake TaxID=1750568 RepID=UPI00190512E1|nr:uncharacterized protein EI90DRAFT_3056977 [Cantharellus anzutake]KAF8331697.1 hypothetical protein EI90DRAFT_3056977 [Cantharellus anzutake]
MPILPHNTMSLSVPNISNACNDLRNCQTMWNIVYTCLLTIIACIWTAVHPDIPKPNYSLFKHPGSSHGPLMILSLVALEVLLGGALGDLLDAQRVSKGCRMIEGWTDMHSFFVIMCGFFDPSIGAVIPKRNENPLDVLKQYPGIIESAGKVAVAKEEILDRSKGDWFAKFIVILQLLWFIIHYIGRWAGGLHSSQLETMTLAYATLSVIDYVLWWHKPTLIQLPIHVTKDSSCFEPPSFRDIDADQPEPSVEKGAVQNLTLAEIVGYGPVWASVAMGITFGGIHCLAWSFPFPTPRETILWWVSVIIIVACPIPYALHMSTQWITLLPADDTYRSALGNFFFCITCCQAVDFCSNVARVCGFLMEASYVIAQIILLVLTITTLCLPPPDLYQTPSWTSFLPHLG